jgi:uncharacterized protein YfaS (alpha-2-macroglobulin family)
MLSILISGLLSVSFAQQKNTAVQVFPQGSVKSVTQVRIQFPKPMVKLGELNVQMPAQSDCFKEGSGRWADTQNWVFDFKSELPGGTRCVIAVENQKFEFNTGGASIKETFPNRYSRKVDPEQSFVISLDAKVDEASVEQEAHFIAEGLGDKLPIEILHGSAAAEVLEAAKKEFQYEREGFAGELLVIHSKRAFPIGGKVTLIWPKNILSASGLTSLTHQGFEFNVRDAFKAEMNCEREAPGKPCIPLGMISVRFTAGIPVRDAKATYLLLPNGKKLFPDGIEGDSNLDFRTSLSFKGPYPALAELQLVIPPRVKDEDGRMLANQNQFPLKFMTADYPSLLKFAADFGVIEAGPDASASVTLRHVEKSLPTRFEGYQQRLAAAQFPRIIQRLDEVQSKPVSAEPFNAITGIAMQKMEVKKPLAAKETEVVGIPLKQKGFYTIEMKSPQLGLALTNEKKPIYIRTAMLVTNMAVHLKYTEEEVLAWVTDLKSATPVSGAKVHVLSKKGKVLATGTTDGNGLLKLAVKGEQYEAFYVMAEKGDDFTFTNSSWDRGIESWRYQLSQGSRLGKMVGHAIMDRTLLRPDETLSAKIVLRRPSVGGLSIPTKGQYPSEVKLVHDSGGQTFKVPLTWKEATGTAEIKWKIPQGVRLGRWTLQLEKAHDYYLEIGDLRIEYFRIPLMRAHMTAQEKFLVTEKNPKFNVGAEFLSGGGAKKLPMLLRYSVEPLNPDIKDDDYQDYQWMNGGIKEGLFRGGNEEIQSHIPQSGKQDITLDNTGGAQVQIKDLKYGLSPQKLFAELEFKDPNGEIQNVGRAFALWPADRMVGIRARSWWAKKDRVDFDVAVLDLNQKPVANAAVKVNLYTSQYLSHRKRLVGGFYAYEDFQEVKKVGELCQGRTNQKGILVCSGKSSFAGSVVAVASVQDSQGREALARTQQWIIGDQIDQWFGSQDNDRVDLIPLKRFYEPGDKAQFQLRTPFNSAKVLLTIEREGVIETKVLDVKSENPSFELPIKPEYAPNVVVSAFAIRGRLDGVKPTALLDLAKPAFKLGMTEIKVGWGAHKLKVTVTADKATYQVREKAKVKIKVVDNMGQPAAGAEVALAGVDEGLLELRDNKSWDILSAMMTLHQHRVMTATMQTFIVGKRHFGLKALPIGGDGRGSNLRELFETLLYWNPSVKLNAQGEADVIIPLNDSLTSFRFVGVALKGAEQFGSGWTNVQSTQDLMIFSGLASSAREGDEMSVEYTLRNTSTQNQTVTVQLSTTPLISGLAAQKITLTPQEAKAVSWRVKVPMNISTLEYRISATNAAGKILDQMKKSQTIFPVIRPEIYQSQMGQWPDLKSIELGNPEGAIAGRSSVVVDLSASLIGNNSGIVEFWKWYPYSCLEQQVSKAVSLQDKKAWDKLMSRWSLYLDDNGLLKYFPDSRFGSENLTSYILALAHEAGWGFSEEHEIRMLTALKDFAEGRRANADGLSRADGEIQKITAMEALSRYRRLDLASLSTLSMQLEQWPLHTLVEWYNILRWEKKAPGHDLKMKQVEDILRSRMYFSARRFKFKEETRDQMPWLMRTPDVAGIRLILATMDDGAWSKDTPRMVLGLMDRQTKGSWNLTTANAWGTLMLRKYAERFEKVKPQGEMLVTLGTEGKKQSWKKSDQGSFEFPIKNEKAAVQFKQEGAGKPWITASLKAAVVITKSLNAGYAIEKEYIPVEQKKSGSWSRGDIIKVRLKVKAQSPMSWVVVQDPIPSGASVLGSGLGRDSALLTQKNVDELWSDFVERGQDSVKFYYSWFPRGEFTVEYTLRLNQAGVFQMPQSRVEAMYSPDLFAEEPNKAIQVLE